MKRGIVSYDISITKFRTELSNILKIYGERIQLSVFEFEVNNDEYKNMVKDIQKFHMNYITYCIHKSIDDSRKSIRIYSICESCNDKVVIIGNNKNSKKDEVIII